MITAAAYLDFAKAMTTKLIRELATDIAAAPVPEEETASGVN